MLILKKIAKNLLPYFIVNKIQKNKLNKMSGKIRWQNYFEEMYFSSLHGMNIGIGGDCSMSGEKNALELISNKLRDIDNIVVFDVGANIGNYSNMIYEVFGNKSKIFAFEPSKITYNKLAENTKNIKNIFCYNFGFGDVVSKTKLYTDADGSGLASVYKRNLQHFNIDMNQEETIEMNTIDKFCSAINWGGVSHIHFLKLDVEGHELKILKGAKEKIEANSIDYIQFEFGGCNIDSRTYFQDFWYLLNNKYIFYRILKDGLYEINSYKEIYECFITTNFLLERKKLL